MYNIKTGQFIAQLRKSNNLTQKELAEKLFITDKAVSKWERGLSLPDISILQPLSDILGVTVSEILNGESAEGSIEQTATSVKNVLDYANENRNITSKKVRLAIAIGYTVTLFIGIITCAICDFAVSGAFTWSLIPIYSSIYAWAILFPVIKFGEKGTVPCLIAVTVLTIPFLYILERVIGSGETMMRIGTPIVAVSVTYMWVIYIVFHLCKKRYFLAFAITCILANVLEIAINIILLKIINEPIVDVWDIMTMGILVGVSFALFVLDYKHKIKKTAV